MLGLTKKEAIRRHRLMWNWIAQTSIQEQRCVSKREAFKHFFWRRKIQSDCWCCEYSFCEARILEYGSARIVHPCDRCPINWNPAMTCYAISGLYSQFCDAYDANDYIKAAKIAYQIAELPERND